MGQSMGDNSLRYRALMQLLRAADAVVDTSRSFFSRWDLGPSQFNVLNLLRLNPDGLSQTDLSHLLIVNRSNVTGLIDRLEKRGLVQRKEVAADRRAYRVVLTRSGRSLLGEILEPYYQGVESLWKGLPEAQVAGLLDGLQVVTENSDRVAGRLAEARPANHSRSRTHRPTARA